VAAYIQISNRERVDAFRWTGGPDQEEDPAWIVRAIRTDLGKPNSARITSPAPGKAVMTLYDFEASVVTVHPGDWLVHAEGKGVHRCSPFYFHELFKPVEEGR
jgi:hypothetical protein